MKCLGAALGIVWALTQPIQIVQAQAPTHPYGYLIVAANEIHEIQTRAPTLTAADLARVANIACMALNRLLTQDEFGRDLQRLEEARRSSGQRARQLQQSLREFLVEFLAVEERELRKAGVSEPVIRQLGYVMASFKDRAGPLDLNSGNIRVSLSNARAASCDLVEQLRQGIERDERDRRAFLLSAMLGGSVIIVVDAMSAVATGGVAGAVATLSGAIGLVMVQEPWKELAGLK